MERLTKETVGVFNYALKDHKATVGEFGTYDAFFDYSMAVKKLGEYEDAEERGELVRLIAPNGCNFCRGVRFMAGNFEGSFPLDEYHNEVIQTICVTDFYFCPMCGRPLTSREEAETALANDG